MESDARLLAAADRISGLAWEHRQAFGSDMAHRVSDRPRSLAILIMTEMCEIATMCEFLAAEIRDYRAVATLVDESVRETDGELALSDEDNRAAAARHIRASAGISVHVKALYEWVYHLRNLVKADGSVRNLVPSSALRRLDAFCEVRGSLIAHKAGLRGRRFGAIRFRDHFAGVELAITGWDLPALASAELDSLFSACRAYLDPADAEQQNFYERCRILSANQHRFDGALRHRIVSFLRAYGGFTEDPAELAEFVADLATRLVPRLAALCQSRDLESRQP